MLPRVWLALVVIAACARADAPAAKTPAAERPVLRVGTSGDYAPFSRTGAGFDVDVAERMARDLGYRIEWVPFRWPELSDAIASNRFDIGMSGITWRPTRAVVGRMSRAVAIGGPCVLSRGVTGTVAVNRGGILEQWARTRYAPDKIRTVDDNLALPRLLEAGEVDAIVTDSFEVAHFARDGWTQQCETPRDRKVYWLSPAVAAELGPRVDRWIERNEAELAVLRRSWFGTASPRGPVEHLVDLLARRLALMPAVAAYKQAHELPIEDQQREAIVVERALDDAEAAGLDRDSVRALFLEQIALAKAVQGRTTGATAMDLTTELRPTLIVQGARIVTALAACADELPALQMHELDLLAPMLPDVERRRLLAALRQVRRAKRVGDIEQQARALDGDGVSVSADSGLPPCLRNVCRITPG